MALVEDTGGFEVDIFAVTAKHDVAILDGKHTEIGKGLRGVCTELDLTTFDHAVDLGFDEVGIATHFDGGETSKDLVDILIDVVSGGEFGDTVV